MVDKLLAGLFSLALLTGCMRTCCDFSPNLCYCPQPRHICALPSPFEEPVECQEKEIGHFFAKEWDFYRAITAYKRALFLCKRDSCSAEPSDLQKELEYSIILAYYLGNQYQSALESFECSSLVRLSTSFPGCTTLLTLLADSYDHDCRPARAEAIVEIIQRAAPEVACKLKLSHALRSGCIAEARALINQRAEWAPLSSTLDRYCRCRKSPCTAGWLNALLPGAGYWYVGQRWTGVTSLFLNALFIWTAYEFFQKDCYGAGIIASSLELGWYFGGIHGARIAANTYNENLYRCLVHDEMVTHRLYPVLLFEYGF